MSMRPEQIEAHRMLTELEPGDPVILVSLPGDRRQGTEAEPLRVQPFGRGRADEPYGSLESYGITVGYGPGRWNTRVTVDALAGYGPVRAGKPMGAPTVRLERVTTGGAR